MNEQTLKRLTDRIFYLPHRRDTDRPVLAAVSGTERTLYMDAGNSPGHAGLFLQELKRFGVAKADLMMLTHWHWDHIFGLKRFGLPLLAHTDTRRAMEAMLGREWTDEALDESVRSGIEAAACAEDIKKEPEIIEKWGRAPAPGDDAFIYWFINGYFLSISAPER